MRNWLNILGRQHTKLENCCSTIYFTISFIFFFVLGSKELLLEQRVPATYLALEDIVSHIGSERRQAGMDPVLNLDQFRTAVNAEMLSRYQKSFRDMAELNQAILFLHENGLLSSICFRS